MELLMLADGSSMTWLVGGIAGAVAGAAAVYAFLTMGAKSTKQAAAQEAARLIENARRDAQELAKTAEIDSRATLLARQQEFDQQTATIRNELREAEKRLDKREDVLERKLDMLSTKEKQIETGEARVKERQADIDKKSKEIDEILIKQRNELLKVANLPIEEAKRQLFSKLENELEMDCAQIISKRVSEAEDTAEEKSREIVIAAIQRYAAPQTTENTVSTVDIPSDEMKGRVIGREGRNIRAFEKATGVDVVVDDTPGVILVTGFDPVRREIARQSMLKLIQDGRIHPTRIEEVVEEMRQHVEKQILEIGKKASMEANMPNLNKRLIELLGRLSYRTSYSQNVLRHSIEVAYLCQLMADELGLDSTLARRCGLLHDIGKAVPQDVEGTHPAVGEEICRKCGEPPEVLNAVAGHHGDVPSTSPYTPLVMAADAMSASRPGSRRESLERYVKRLEQLEEIATRHRGVKQAFAIQAGREVRVIVDAEHVDDANAMRIAREIAKQIEADMTYPGEVKVTLLRETRAVEYAR